MSGEHPYRRIFRYWVPMFGTWLIMALEAPLVAAVIARMDDPKQNLAAFGVAYAVAIKLGIDVDGVSSKGGILFGALVAAKVSQPVRIVLTVVLTPFVASVLRRPPTPQAAPEE